MFLLVKLVVVIAVVLIGLKIFLPETADSLIDQISNATGIEESVIHDNLDKATEVVEDTAKEAKEEALQKVNNSLE